MKVRCLLPSAIALGINIQFSYEGRERRRMVVRALDASAQ